MRQGISRRCLNPADRHGPALPQVHLVEVHLQDPVLLVARIEQYGHRGLAELAPPRAFLSEEEVLDRLLRDGAAALDDSTMANVRYRGPQDAADI